MRKKAPLPGEPKQIDVLASVPEGKSIYLTRKDTDWCIVQEVVPRTGLKVSDSP